MAGPVFTIRGPLTTSGRRRALAAVSVMLCAGWSAACGTTSAGPAPGDSGAGRTAATSSASGAPAVEHNPPGDIPDSQTFVPYRGVGYSITVPEGWSQRTGNGIVRFDDKYTSVTLVQRSVAGPPTPTSVRTQELPGIATSTPGYHPGAVRDVQRTAGRAVLITYRARSETDPVTGKYAITDVERYEFWRNGREVIVTLAAPVGADNVDPWRTITNSFAWHA